MADVTFVGSCESWVGKGEPHASALHAHNTSGDRAGLLFGQAFESALGAFFCRRDCAEVWFREWSAYLEAAQHYSKGDTWDRMLRQGIQLLERFCQDARLRVPQPQRNLQIKLVRSLSPQNEFVAYVDAIGYLDGTRCVLEWKTTSSRYPEKPGGAVS